MMAKDKFIDITNDELIEEVRWRDLEDRFQEDDDEDDDALVAEMEEEYKHNYHMLPKNFDRFQLRDHLCNIARLGSYVSDEKLFDTIRDLLEFS